MISISTYAYSNPVDLSPVYHACIDPEGGGGGAGGPDSP